MFRKKLLAMGLIITIALCGLSGCTGNTTTAPQETTTPEVTTGQEETSTEEEETTTEKSTSEEETVGGVMGYVDAEDIFRHILINNEYVNQFPWTLKSLGKKFSVSDNVTMDVEENKATMFLEHNEQGVAMISAKIETEFNENSLIYRIHPFYGIDNILMYDLGEYSTEEDVVERFGVPTSFVESEKENYYYYNTTQISLELEFDRESGCLETWTIELTDEFLEDLQGEK